MKNWINRNLPLCCGGGKKEPITKDPYRYYIVITPENRLRYVKVIADEDNNFHWFHDNIEACVIDTLDVSGAFDKTVPYRMIIDDEGALNGSMINHIATRIYHKAQPSKVNHIYGDVIIGIDLSPVNGAKPMSPFGSRRFADRITAFIEEKYIKE